MDILPVVLLAVCGVAVVLGFLGLLAFGVLRQHAPKLMELLGGAGAMLGDIEPPPNVKAQQTYQRRKPNLRQKAEALDFNSALAHTQLDNQSVRKPATTNPTAPPWSTSGTPGASSQSASQNPPTLAPPTDTTFDTSKVSSLRRRKRRDRNQDEIFANKLDEDGDEWMDF